MKVIYLNTLLRKALRSSLAGLLAVAAIISVGVSYAAPPKLLPASPVPAPEHADPMSIAVAPDAPMLRLTSTPPPPAFALADNMFDTGNFTGAVNKLQDVAKSASYRNSPYVPASIYRIAQIERDYMHQDQAAMQQYATLVNQYSGLVYPGSATVVAERQLLGERIDHENAGKPLYKFISFCVELTGARSYSYWLALLMIAVLVRVVLTPLTIKQYKGMREMQRLQPLLKEIQAKYEKDPALKSQKMMELYKEHNANPLNGCLPMVLQLPVYWGMYQAIVQYQYHFSHGTFLWINPVTSAWANKFYPGLVGKNLMEQDLILLLIYSVSMYVTQRMMPQSDPSQAEMMKTQSLMMSVFFFIMFIQWHFPSAFVLYWLFSNILSTVTQLYYMRGGEVPPPGVQPVLPRDGEGPNGGKGGTLPAGASLVAEGAPTRKAPTAKPAGTARGIIAPKNHPKKKRR